MKELFGLIVLVVALSGCNQQKKMEIVLQNEVDSLRLEVSTSKQMNATLQEIGLMMDSVDVLRTGLAQGKYGDNPGKLREINKFVASMQSRSDQIEKQLEKGTGMASIYSRMITRLQKDLTMKTEEFSTLTETVAFHKGINDTLRMTVELQAAELNDGEATIAVAEQDIARLEQEVKQLTAETKSHAPDTYDERATSLEEAARRTALAIEKSKSL